MYSNYSSQSPCVSTVIGFAIQKAWFFLRIIINKIKSSNTKGGFFLKVIYLRLINPIIDFINPQLRSFINCLLYTSVEHAFKGKKSGKLWYYEGIGISSSNLQWSFCMDSNKSTHILYSNSIDWLSEIPRESGGTSNGVFKGYKLKQETSVVREMVGTLRCTYTTTGHKNWECDVRICTCVLHKTCDD